MPRTMVYIIGDDFDVIEKVKSSLVTYGVGTATYGVNQWRDGLENSYFRSQLLNSTPSLMAGSSTVEARGNIISFPPNPHPNENIQTMEEMEGKAIEKAIAKYRGNLTEAARALGIGRATLYRKVKQYQIDPQSARRKRVA